MTRLHLPFTSCALTLAFIWPTLGQATDTRAPRSQRRATVSRGIGFSAVIANTRPPTTRRPTTQARPTRPTTTLNRNSFKRPDTQRPTRQPASLRELNNLRLPAARPVVTRPPAKRPTTLRPTGRPDRPAGSAVEAPKRNALKTFLDEVDTQGNRQPGRLPERVDRKIFQVDRAGNAIRPVITENPQRNAAPDPDQPVKDSSQEDAATKPEALDAGDNDALSDDAVEELQESELDKGPQQLEPAEGEPGKSGEAAADEENKADEAGPEDPNNEEPVADPVPAEEEIPADSEPVNPDSPNPSFIILPGFTFIFGGGTQLVHETLYVDNVTGTTGVQVDETVITRLEEVASLPEVRAGATYNLSSKNLGNTEGHVVILVNELYLNTTVDQWSNDGATVTLPLVGMVKPQRAALLMMSSQGELVESIDVMFLPATKE